LFRKCADIISLRICVGGLCASYLLHLYINQTEINEAICWGSHCRTRNVQKSSFFAYYLRYYYQSDFFKETLYTRRVMLQASIPRTIWAWADAKVANFELPPFSNPAEGPGMVRFSSSSAGPIRQPYLALGSRSLQCYSILAHFLVLARLQFACWMSARGYAWYVLVQLRKHDSQHSSHRLPSTPLSTARQLPLPAGVYSN